MSWSQIGEFTLTQNWQYTAPLAGQLFRLRHLTTDQEARGLLSQGFLGETLELLDTRRISPKGQHDLIMFDCPDELLTERRIAVKLNSFSTTSWTVAIDVFLFGEPVDTSALVAIVMAAHEQDVSAHSQYVDAMELAAAIADRVTNTELAAAIADLVDNTELTAAIADKVTAAQMTAALLGKADVLNLTLTTIGNTLTEMNSPQRVTVKPNSTTGYELHLTAQNMNNAGNPEYIHWFGTGTLTRGASAASTVLNSATGTRRSSAGNGSNWGPTLTADTVNGGLKIQVKGDLTKTVKWAVSVQLFEVS